MRILVTNDDGIHAPGLKVAEQIARTLTDDVWVVAPAEEKSGASHSLTLTRPVRLRAFDDRHYSLTGTPTDCVMFGCAELLKDHRPDLVISGVNSGVNVADDVTYSGTIAGAMEGCTLGIPSIALSQGYPFSLDRQSMSWDCAATHGPKIVKKLLDAGWPDGVLMNINFPNCAPDEVAGTEVVMQGKREHQDVKVDHRVDLRGFDYYWIAFKRDPNSSEKGTDLVALIDQKISVTPLHLNLTAPNTLKKLQQVFSD